MNKTFLTYVISYKLIDRSVYCLVLIESSSNVSIDGHLFWSHTSSFYKVLRLPCLLVQHEEIAAERTPDLYYV